MSRTGVIRERHSDDEQPDCVDVCIAMNAVMKNPPCTYENFEKFHAQCESEEHCQGRLSSHFFDEKCLCSYIDYNGECGDGECGYAPHHNNDCHYWKCERCARECGCDYEARKQSCRGHLCRNQSHAAACRHYECEDCQTQSSSSSSSSNSEEDDLFDAHTQDCFFNGCTTAAHTQEEEK